jgi:methionine sulfoxide reductase heme-binding subunit
MAFHPTQRQVSFIKAALFAACLLPTARLVWRFATDGLGANPIEYITRATGWWTLAFLAITLAVTPARRWLAMPWLLRLRRMLGLFAFFHACQHFTTYVWLDQFFDWPGMLVDIAKRPFVTVGFAAFVLLVPLAVTSTNAMVRRLGARRWQWLHRLVYGIAILGVIHFWWLVKKDITEPALFAGVIGLLLASRLVARPGTPSAGRSATRPVAG